MFIAFVSYFGPITHDVDRYLRKGFESVDRLDRLIKNMGFWMALYGARRNNNRKMLGWYFVHITRKYKRNIYIFLHKFNIELYALFDKFLNFYLYSSSKYIDISYMLSYR